MLEVTLSILIGSYDDYLEDLHRNKFDQARSTSRRGFPMKELCQDSGVISSTVYRTAACAGAAKMC